MKNRGNVIVLVVLIASLTVAGIFLYPKSTSIISSTGCLLVTAVMVMHNFKKDKNNNRDRDSVSHIKE